MTLVRMVTFNRDFPTAPPEVYAILCLCKERLCQESTLRRLRREVRFIMSPPGKRRHNELNAAPPPETPPGNGQAGSYSRQRWGTQQRKFPYSGQNLFVRRTARHDPNFGFPSEGKLRPQAVMRCRFRLRNRFLRRKSNFMPQRRAVGATPHPSAFADTFPSKGKAIQFAAERLTVRAPTCPRCATCTDPSPPLPMRLWCRRLKRGSRGHPPCSSFFPFSFSGEKNGTH